LNKRKKNSLDLTQNHAATISLCFCRRQRVLETKAAADQTQSRALDLAWASAGSALRQGLRAADGGEVSEARSHCRLA